MFMRLRERVRRPGPGATILAPVGVETDMNRLAG